MELKTLLLKTLMESVSALEKIPVSEYDDCSRKLSIRADLLGMHKILSSLTFRDNENDKPEVVDERTD